MQYRTLAHGNEQISVIGIGSGAIHLSGEKEIEEILNFSVEKGINYFDMAAAEAKPFASYGNALSHYRRDIYFQIHFGADYSSGSYGWTTDLEVIKRNIDRLLLLLKTDYIDFGFIHCLDDISDLEQMQQNGVIEHILDLKKQGVVRHIGLSSHTPKVAQKVIDMGILDMLMFSINPGYDYQHGEYANGNMTERMELYRRCEKEGIGISVMKAFSGGQLLNDKTSPFGKALTEYQCIQYALDKPGVLTVLPGIRNKTDLKQILGFFDSTPEERDYSVIGSFSPDNVKGMCVYCNHCQPCPNGLNVGLINKYYDLAKAGDDLAADHYSKLEINARSCIKCGHCDMRCPFGVAQSARMEEIAEYFAR